MQEFIARENVKLFERKLAEALNQPERDRLMGMIKAEKARLGQLKKAVRSS